MKLMTECPQGGTPGEGDCGIGQRRCAERGSIAAKCSRAHGEIHGRETDVDIIKGIKGGLGPTSGPDEGGEACENRKNYQSD